MVLLNVLKEREKVQRFSGAFSQCVAGKYGLEWWLLEKKAQSTTAVKKCVTQKIYSQNKPVRQCEGNTSLLLLQLCWQATSSLPVMLPLRNQYHRLLSTVDDTQTTIHLDKQSLMRCLKRQMIILTVSGHYWLLAETIRSLWPQKDEKKQKGSLLYKPISRQSSWEQCFYQIQNKV